MTDLEAIQNRTSRRAYSGTLSPAQMQKLEALVAEANLESGLSIRFVADGSREFGGVTKSYGMFAGVHSLFEVAGHAKDKDLAEKAGWWGEKLVLEATKMGLGTCWVGGTFDRAGFCSRLAPGLQLVAVITVGPVKEGKSLIEKTVRKVAGGRKLDVDKLYTADETPPGWFLQGMQAVALAPSAMNRQPVRFTWKNGVAAASIPDEEGAKPVDMGIAKCHFCAAVGGSFALGSGGVFTPGGQ